MRVVDDADVLSALAPSLRAEAVGAHYPPTLAAKLASGANPLAELGQAWHLERCHAMVRAHAAERRLQGDTSFHYRWLVKAGERDVS